MQIDTTNTTPVDNDAAFIYETSTATFAKDVIEASKDAIVLVDFWADWCGPCKVLAPRIEALSEKYAGRVFFGKVDIDKNPEDSGTFRC